MWGIWLIDKSLLGEITFGRGEMEDNFDQMEFKLFSHQCRLKQISQRMDIKYPGIHLEKSKFPIIPWEYFKKF